MDNYAIADQFSLLSKLMDINGENSFKTKTYSVASFNIEKLPGQLKDLPREKIFGIKGIGESVGKKIVEMLDTGQLALLDEYLQKTPPGIVEMLYIKGIGPKKINTIWKELEVESLGELLYACNENRLLLYKGFGDKTQNNIRESIEFYLKNQGSYLYAEIENYAQLMDKNLKESFPPYRTEITGAFRRQSETIDLLEWCTTIPVHDAIKFFKGYDFEIVQQSDEHLFLKAKENVEIKIHLVDEPSFFAKLFSTSCSSSFMEAFEKLGILKNETVHLSEESIFQAAGMDFIDPPLRENENIFVLAKENKLPVLIQPSDIKAIIHSHSNWSDGVNTIEEMVKASIEKRYEYLVISDHSKSAFYAKGLFEDRIKEQHLYIDELNEKYKPFKIFKSIECDILNDGNLDYTNEVLSTFDLVIASIHSNLKMTEEKAMSRLLNAISNPYVTILGHMTGRLLLSRNGYPADHKRVIDACAANQVIIELNSHPRRLDIDWRWIDYALEKGVLLSVDPDAHSLDGFNDVKYGVLAAQKGGLTKEQNFSSFSLAQVEKYLEERRKLKGI